MYFYHNKFLNDLDTEGDEDDDDDDEKSNKSRNGESSYHAETSAASNEPQPGTSSGIRNGSNGSDKEIESTEAEGEANENLQFAWEALEMAARIFRRLGKH